MEIISGFPCVSQIRRFSIHVVNTKERSIHIEIRDIACVLDKNKCKCQVENAGSNYTDTAKPSYVHNRNKLVLSKFKHGQRRGQKRASVSLEIQKRYVSTNEGWVKLDACRYGNQIDVTFIQRIIVIVQILITTSILIQLRTLTENTTVLYLLCLVYRR